MLIFFKKITMLIDVRCAKMEQKTEPQFLNNAALCCFVRLKEMWSMTPHCPFYAKHHGVVLAANFQKFCHTAKLPEIIFNNY
jgi:hypothetical protein